MLDIAGAFNIRHLEYKLLQQTDNQQRLLLIDKLASHYAFTNIRKAQKLLAEQRKILDRYDFPDLLLNYHLNTAIVENQLYNYYLAEIHFLKAIELLDERGGIKQQAEAYIDYAGTCMNLAKMEPATKLLRRAGKQLTAFPDERLQARLVCREGYLNLHYSNFSKATELFLEADKAITTLGDDLDIKDYYFLTLIHSGLGKIYERNTEREQSVRAYLNVVHMCESMEMRSRLSWHYLNVGVGYMALNEEENAEAYFKKAINITDDVSQYARASAYANLGHCYFQKKLYNEALELYQRAEVLYKEKSPRDFYNFSILESWKAQLYAETNRRRRAMKHFAAAYAYAEIIEDYRQLSDVCKNISTFYADIGDYKSAYEYLVEHDKMEELYIEQVNKRQRLELEVKYEAEKRQREAELLRLQSTKLQLKALRAQMNPHFMFNALNSIQNYITSNEVTFAAKYLSKFARLMRQALEYSDKEIISLEEEVEFLKDYLLINAKLRFEDKLEYKVIMDDDIEEDIFGVPTMIIQPYVENAIEHGLRPKNKGLIKIHFQLYDEHTICCVVEDNGIGRDRARKLQEKDPNYENHKSRGTNITERRLDILHRSTGEEVYIQTIDMKDEASQEALGTRVEIKIPIIEMQIKSNGIA